MIFNNYLISTQSDMETTNKTILVTGGNGYIGSHTVVELIEKGFKVIIVDNLSNSSPKCLERVKEITMQQELVWENIDICKEEQLRGVFTKHGPFYGVIHFAAFKAVGESVQKPLQYYENNVGGSVTLLKLVQEFKVPVFVFSSSACVYGENPLAKEDDPICPINPYGQTKVMVE